MLEYKIAQKQQNAREAVMYQVSHTLSWLLNFIVQFAASFIKDMFQAVKMLIHI